MLFLPTWNIPHTSTESIYTTYFFFLRGIYYILQQKVYIQHTFSSCRDILHTLISASILQEDVCVFSKQKDVCVHTAIRVSSIL